MNSFCLQQQQKANHCGHHHQKQQRQQHQHVRQGHPQQLLLLQQQQLSAAALSQQRLGSSSTNCRSRSSSNISRISSSRFVPGRLQQQQQSQRLQPPHAAAAAGAAAADGSDGDQQHHHHHQQQQQAGVKSIPPRIMAAADEDTYSLRDTQVLVETAMLSAVSGLAFLLSTLLKLDNSLGYFLPLPITIAACRSGVAAGWHTMMATAFLLLVLLGPLRAITYVLMHGVLAASLGSMWVAQWPWQVSIPAGAVLRMSGQLGYLVLSSLTMNENLFSVMLANVHNLLDQLSAALGSYGSPSTLAITCMIFALLLVNGLCYCFLLHVVYHVILGSMGFKLGALPGFVRKYLYAGVPQQQQQQQR